MTRNSIIRIALFALVFIAVSTALDTAFGFKVTFVKQAIEAACATLGWMLALKWFGRNKRAGGVG